MTITTRRTVLGAIAGVVTIAGCTTEEGEGGSDGVDGREASGTGDDEAAGGDLTEEEIVALFEAILVEEGVDPVAVERVEDVLEVAYDATGMTDDDAAFEIAVVAGTYARAIEAGLTTERLEATVHDPDEGAAVDSFVVETEWAGAYVDEEIDWEEYFGRVVETFEPSEPADDGEEPIEDELVDLLVSTLSERGIEPVAIERTDGALGVVYHATDAGDQALAAEVEVVADVYAAAVDDGLSVDRLALTRRDPDDGVDLEAFVVETEWALAYLDEEIEWEEYLDRVEATVEPIETGDTEPEADGETEEPDEDGEAEEPDEDGEAEEPVEDGEAEEPVEDGEEADENG